MKARNYIVLALLAVPTVVAARGLLPLKSGTYVREGWPCHDAAFASMVVYDGKTFSDPHSSQCRSDMVFDDGAHYQVRTRCDADGAGDPVPNPYSETVDYTILSRTKVVIAHKTAAGRVDSVQYRRCGAVGDPLPPK